MQWNPVMAGVVRAVGSLHARLFGLFGGPGLLGRNILVLTTRGRKTGTAHATALLFVRDGERLYVVASFGGSDTPPGWYKNLVATPDVEAQPPGAAPRRYRARTLGEAEAAPVWPKLLAIYPAFADYQKRTTRRIPIVELTPIP